MIKKAANYFLACLLLFSVIGISINKHYSCKKLYSVSVFSEPDSCCDELCDCCNETTEVYQITDVFLQSVFQFEHNVRNINISIWFNNFAGNFYSEENAPIAFIPNKDLNHTRQNSPAQLQCFRL